MDFGPQLLLIAAVAGVGVLHTMVPDHWVPITLVARQRGWSPGETAWAALLAGTGHVVSTLIIAIIVWTAGALVAERFGQLIDTLSSVALIGFGGWIAISAWRDLQRSGHGHGHSHSHDFQAFGVDDIHGPELQRIPTRRGPIELSIFEEGVPPHFRLTGAIPISLTTERGDGRDQVFRFADRGAFWQSTDEIPEPHGFDIVLMVTEDGRTATYRTRFVEHAHAHGHAHDHGHSHDHDDDHGHDKGPAPRDDLYAPLQGELAVLTHAHVHRHGGRTTHAHRHDHIAETVHAFDAAVALGPPEHQHAHRTSARTALLLIVGSSPMVEGIPAFFAASRYGLGLIAVMSLVFAVSTMVTYVALCVLSTVGLQRLRLGPIERYGEVLSGVFIALVGLAFWIWPVL